MKNISPFAVLFLVLCYCSSNDKGPINASSKDVEGCTASLSDNFATDATVDNGTCTTFDCTKCKYTVPAKTNLIDGAKLGLKAGDIICLDAAIKYANLHFINIIGSAGNYIKIANCGGNVKIDASGAPYGIKTENSKYFEIQGVGSNGSPYGITIFGPQQGMQLEGLSTNFIVSHLEIYNTGFAGIMAKTDPSCTPGTDRGNFTMRDVEFHHNYIHDTGGEGFYVGNSFYKDGVKLSPCGVRLPHSIEGVKIYQNLIKKTGWDGLQLGSATKSAQVYNNTIEDFGTANKADQWSGIQLGEGTGGLCYNNLILNGSGQGLNVLGLGDNLIYNNVVVNAKQNGAFCDTRFSPGPGFQFINNTIINPGLNGIRIWAALGLKNVIVNNIIVNPGLPSQNGSGPDDAFVHTSKAVIIDLANNYYTNTIGDVKFKSPGDNDFSLTAGSPAIDKGRTIADFNYDFLGSKRPNGAAYDIGAFEY